MPARLADAMARKRETDVQDYLYNSIAGNTSYTDADGNTITITGGDGLNLHSASHTREDGGTVISNRNFNGTTYNMDLAEDALVAAETYVAPRILDGKGQKMALHYKRLLIPRELSATAQRLMQTDRKVGSADWDINIVKGKYQLVEMPYFNTSGAAYWILYDPDLGSDCLVLLWSQPVKLEGPELVFDTGSFKYRATMQYDLKHNDFRAYQTSEGDNVT